MSFKPYEEPRELQILRCLIPRMKLVAGDHQQYVNLEKGHKGEQIFANMLDSFTNDWIILYGLLLEHNKELFQIDSILISQQTVYIFDQKNYEGEFYVESDNWYTRSGKKIMNPIHQLNRSVLLLERLLQKYGFSFTVKGLVVFVNPEFTLFQAPLNLPIILPTQLNRFLQKLSAIPSTTNNRHMKLAEKLTADHLSDSPYTKLPDFNYEQLKKGIVCASCQTLFTSLIGRTIVCGRCGHREGIHSSILRTIKEFRLLFPERKVSTDVINEWCGEIVSKKTISRILRQNFKLRGNGKNSYYE